MTSVAARVSLLPDVGNEALARITESVARFAASWPRVQLGAAHVDALVTGLADLDPDDVDEAVELARRTMTFPPAIAELRLLVAERRLDLPEVGAALELVQRYVAEELTAEPCPAGCRDGLVDGGFCDRCRGEGSIREHKVLLPGPVRRALLAVGGTYDWGKTEHPGAIRREFERRYEEFRRDALAEIVAGTYCRPTEPL